VPAPGEVKAQASTTKKTLANVFLDVGERKLIFQGPDNLRQDSRYAVTEVAADHVVFKLLGDELFVLPFTSIMSVKVERQTMTIRYR
jgi:hypothetical protein